MVEPGKHPKVTTLKDDLDSLQKAVSIGADYQGLIEFVSLGNGDCIMCNEEGKLIGLDGNRRFEKLMRSGSSNGCNRSFGTVGRQVVVKPRGEYPSLTFDGSQVGGREKPSSPASRTKETVERLSLFCQSIVAKSHKTPVFPTKTETQGIFRSLYAICSCLQLFTPISVAPVAQPSPRGDIKLTNQG